MRRAGSDASFHMKSRAVFRERMRGAGFVVVTLSMSEVHALCSAWAVLENGALTYFGDMEEAVAQPFSRHVDSSPVHLRQALVRRVVAAFRTLGNRPRLTLSRKPFPPQGASCIGGL